MQKTQKHRKYVPINKKILRSKKEKKYIYPKNNFLKIKFKKFKTIKKHIKHIPIFVKLKKTEFGGKNTITHKTHG